jgi:hypothetical protein
VLFQDTWSSAAKSFLIAANVIDDYPIGITSADSVFSEYNVDGEAVVLFKKVKTKLCDESKKSKGTFSQAQMMFAAVK